MAKTWLQLVLALSIFVQPLGFASAEPPDAAQTQRAYANQIADLDRELDDLEQYAGTVTNEVAEKVYGLFVAGFGLLNDISHDQRLETEAQAKLIGKLLDKMANTFFQFRRHKEDERNPDGKVTVRTKIARMFIEIGRGLKRTVTWKWPENRRRELLVRRLLALYEEQYDVQVPVINDSPDKVKEFFYGQMHYLVDRNVNISLERDSAQLWARTFYAAMAAFLFLNPPVDYFARDFYSSFNSGVINGSVLGFIWLVQGLSSTRKSTKAWVNLLDNLETGSESANIQDRVRGMLKEHRPGEYFVPAVPVTLRFEAKVQKTLGKVWGIFKKKDAKKVCVNSLSAEKED